MKVKIYASNIDDLLVGSICYISSESNKLISIYNKELFLTTYSIEAVVKETNLSEIPLFKIKSRNPFLLEQNINMSKEYKNIFLNLLRENSIGYTLNQDQINIINPENINVIERFLIKK